MSCLVWVLLGVIMRVFVENGEATKLLICTDQDDGEMAAAAELHL